MTNEQIDAAKKLNDILKNLPIQMRGIAKESFAEGVKLARDSDLSKAFCDGQPLKYYYEISYHYSFTCADGRSFTLRKD